MRVALERHELRHAHAADLGDAPDVVAAEVHEHDVLGALLLVAPQLLGQPLIFVRRRPAPPRAGDRMRLDVPALDAHEHLRRGADDRVAAPIRMKNMYGDGLMCRSARYTSNGDAVGRRRRSAATAPPDRSRRPRCLPESLRTAPSNASRVWLAVTSRPGGRAPLGPRQVALELALEEVDLRAREVVERAQVLARPQPRVGDRQDAVLDVIERQHGVEHHEAGLIAIRQRLVERAPPARTTRRRRSRSSRRRRR